MPSSNKKKADNPSSSIEPNLRFLHQTTSAKLAPPYRKPPDCRSRTTGMGGSLAFPWLVILSHPVALAFAGRACRLHWPLLRWQNHSFFFPCNRQAHLRWPWDGVSWPYKANGENSLRNL